VLATFAVILIANEVIRLIFGPQPVMLNPPAALSGPVTLLPGLSYSSYRLLIIGIGLAVAVVLYILVAKTRTGMLVRAGASNREMATAMGVNIKGLFTVVFGVGAALCAIAGAMLGPILAVQVGMGESILILAFVVIVIGGIGSIRGALVGAMLVGLVDTVGRAFLPMLFREFLPPTYASNLGPAVAGRGGFEQMGDVVHRPPSVPVRGGRVSRKKVRVSDSHSRRRSENRDPDCNRPRERHFTGRLRRACRRPAPPAPDVMKFRARGGVISVEKARKVLGYTPPVSRERAGWGARVVPLDKLMEPRQGTNAAQTTLPEVTVTPSRAVPEDAGGERGRSRGNR